MATPQIGAFQFITKKGPAPIPPAQTVVEITRPGVDSQAYRQQGKRAPVVTWMTEVDTNSPQALLNSYRALQATEVTVVDDDGASFTNVMVLSVIPVSKKKVVNPVGGISAGSWIMAVQWRLQGT